MSLLLLAVALASPAARQTVETPALRAELVAGTIVALENRRTGERLAGPAESLCGAVRKDGAQAFSFHTAPPRGGPGDLVQETAAGVVRTAAAARGEAVVITQSATAPDRLRGARWGLVLPPDAVVLVPGHSGLRLAPDGPARRLEFEYPITWECQFAIVETARGGFLIQALDDAEQFKNLHFERNDQRTVLGFETQALAPWESATSAGPLNWRIEAFSGPWQTAAAAYEAEHRARLGSHPPELAWTRDIRCMVIAMPTDALLAALRETLDPRQTMIYIPGWRVNEYDRNYPDYTPAEGLPERVRAAQAAGFRVMLHVNYFGCTPENAAYAALARYHVRSPRDGSLQYWDWQRVKPPIKFAYVNPAARAWRELFVGKMRELVERTGADALHLDQTLCIYNDANGPIDGLNMMQGNLALHRELREALPRTALGGEGLNELTSRYEQFAQRHLHGLNHADGTWSRAQIAMAHPVSSAVLRPHTAMVGYLGYANPRGHDLYLAWEAGYEAFGIVPTLAHVSAADLRSDDLGMGFAIRRAQRAQALQLEPDFRPLDPPALSAWRDAAGALYPVRREPTGAALFAPGGEVLERRIAGVAEFRGEGSIAGAVAYDEQRIFGLNPSAAYFWGAAPRDPAAPHVTGCQPEVPLSGRIDPAGLTILALGDPLAGRPLLDVAAQPRCGVLLPDGAIRWQAGTALDDESGGTVRPDSQLVFVHPPWRSGEPRPGGPIHGRGHTLIELSVPLPTAAAVFRAEVGLNANASGEQSDGITCRVTASAGGQTRTAAVHAPAGPKTPLELDLSPFAGRETRLLLETTPGPAGNPSFDWGEWSRPRIEVTGSAPARLELVLPRPPAAVVASGRQGELEALGEQRYRAAAGAPGRLYLSAAPPFRLAAGESLLDAPWQGVLIDQHGSLSGSRDFLRPVTGEATVRGETFRGLHTHPPTQGRIEAHLVADVPAGGLALVGAVGLRDGHASEGVRFAIQVSDEVLWRQDLVPPDDGPREFAVDLTRWAGRTVVLTLLVDALGTYDYDWAVWRTLALRARP